MNTIGLPKKESKKIAERLNDLLANYSIFYQNVRGFHWNIKGANFFELHIKFEELYSDLVVKIDELAERILTLEASPNHAYSYYLKHSTIKESGFISKGNDALTNILGSLKIIITKQREILTLSDQIADEGTNSLMSDYIKEQEKLTWMYGAFLSSEK